MKTLALILMLMLSGSLTAQTIDITIWGYVPATVMHIEDTDSYEILSNMDNLDYEFTDADGVECNAEDASFCTVTVR